MPVFDFLKTPEKKAPTKRYEEIPVDRIRPNPNQPRRIFNDEALDELAASIRQVGLIQPLLVRRAEDGYELVAGERRLRAVKSIGMETVPCIVQNDVVDEESAMMALIENLQRENLNFFEEAESYCTLISAYDMTQEELAIRLGKSQSSIANKLRILKLGNRVKAAVMEANLSERHARALLKVRDESVQLELVEKIRQKGLSVKDTERLVEKTINRLYDEGSPLSRPRPMIIRLVKDYRLFMNTINAAVAQLRESGISVRIEQSDRDDGVDISIQVRRNG